MGIIRKILFVVIVLSMSFAGTANASVDCCFKDSGYENVSAMSDAPCHDTQKDAKSKDDICKNCGCQHFVGSLFTLVQLKNIVQKSSVSNSYFNDSFISLSIGGLFQPPKHIS